MSRENPGPIRRFFRFMGKVFAVIRWLLKAAILVVLLAIFFSLVGKDVKPLPEKAALRLVPTGELVEQRSYLDPVNQLMQQSAGIDAETPVFDLVDAIDYAANDARITSLVLDLGYLTHGGISKLEEVGQALLRFRKSGKPVIAISDSYSQDQYYLASFADEIHLNPMGAVLITGYGAYGTYLKDAIDKLNINVHIFRVGDYKSAVEPFSRNDMSEPARQNTATWLNELWDVYSRRVETLRELPVDAIDNYVNNLPVKLAQSNGDMATVALEAGLVDHVSTRPQILDRLRALAGDDNGGGYVNVDHKTYLTHLRLSALPKSTEGTDKVGLIVASGAILDGEQPEGTIGGDTLAALFRQAREDKDIKAIVLRIDSPGGSAFASDIIRQEILLTRQKGIPVVASMGAVAASGGYWIAASADQIWALPTTITGSIGVFGIIPTFENALDALGVHSDGIGTTSLSDMYHLERPLSPEASEIIQKTVENIYSQFLALVAKGRNSTSEEVHEVAQGQVWSGLRAVDLGLVDSLGNRQDAINAAAKLAGLEKWQVKTISRTLTFQEQLLKQLTGASARLGLKLDIAPALPDALVRPMEVLSRELEAIGMLNDPNSLYLRCFGCEAP